jgi:hypothetical protein
VQTRAFGPNGRQECEPIAGGKLIRAVEDLGRRLDGGDPVQQLLFFRVAYSHVLASGVADQTAGSKADSPDPILCDGLQGPSHRLPEATVAGVIDDTMAVAGLSFIACKVVRFLRQLFLPASASTELLATTLIESE